MCGNLQVYAHKALQADSRSFVQSKTILSEVVLPSPLEGYFLGVRNLQIR